jgi:peptide deformylase
VLQHEIDHLDGILTVDRAEASVDVMPVEDEPS